MTKIFVILTFLLFASCADKPRPDKKLANEDSTEVDTNHFEGSLLQRLMQKNHVSKSVPDTNRPPDLKYSKKIDLDTLRLALKNSRKLGLNFSYKDIKLDIGNYYHTDALKDQEKLIKKLNPRFISFTSDLKDYNTWYFGQGGVSLISGYFHVKNLIVIIVSMVGHECDSGIQRYWLAAIKSDGTISEPIVIHDEHGDFGYYLMDFSMQSDTSIRLSLVYDVESNILPESRIDTTRTEILSLNISKIPFDTISLSQTFKIRPRK